MPSPCIESPGCCDEMAVSQGISGIDVIDGFGEILERRTKHGALTADHP